jgi:P-type Cu+ transporter
MKRIKITIQGMHCSSCASNIERSVKKVKGINSISVSLMTNKGIIEAEDSINPENIKNAVSKVGYKVTDIE